MLHGRSILCLVVIDNIDKKIVEDILSIEKGVDSVVILTFNKKLKDGLSHIQQDNKQIDIISFPDVKDIKTVHKKYFLKNIAIEIAKRGNFKHLYIFESDTRNIVEKLIHLKKFAEGSDKHFVTIPKLSKSGKFRCYEPAILVSNGKLTYIGFERASDLVRGQFEPVMAIMFDNIYISLEHLPDDVGFSISGEYNPDLDFCFKLFSKGYLMNILWY